MKDPALSQTTQNLDSSKQKDFADDNFRFDEDGRKFSKRVENTVGKGEIARYEQFLHFPQCLQKIFTAYAYAYNKCLVGISVISRRSVHLSMLSPWSSFNQCFALSKPLAAFPNNHCRNNGQRERNVAMTIINPRKEYWPSRGSIQRPPVLKSATPPIELWGSARMIDEYRCSTKVKQQRAIYEWNIKILTSMLNTFPNKPCFSRVSNRSLLKTLWEKEKLLVTSNFSFSQSVFYPFWELTVILNQIWICHLQALSVWKSLKFVIWERVKSMIKIYRRSSSERFIQSKSRLQYKK